MNSHIPFQIPLSVSLRDDTRFENFGPQGNELACATLGDAAAGVGEQFLFLWGEGGVGCTHLLQAAYYRAQDLRKQAAYLPLDELKLMGPGVLAGMEQLDLVCMDNVQAVIGDKKWEEGLFHFYNRMRQANKHLVMAAKAPPQRLGVKLPDLASRMNWGITFQVYPLADQYKREVFVRRAASRGIELAEDVVKYLFSHASLDMKDLYDLLDKLDQASLSAQRKVTIPFIKEVTGM